MMLNVMTIVMDILWILTMRSVWSTKPIKNANSWAAFDNIRGLTLFLSFVNVVLKVLAVMFLLRIYNGSSGKRLQAPSMASV